METSSIVPFYLDLKFWSFILSLTAFLLSQLPPIKLWFKPKKLNIEAHHRVNITHKVGNPNFSFLVSLSNTGGRNLRITAMKVKIFRDGKDLVELPAQNYYESQKDQFTVFFVPFTIKPGDDWSHTVRFLNFFDRTTDKSYRANESALRLDVQKKISARDESDKNAVIAQPELVEPFYKLFDKLFVWEPGEYVFEIIVDTKPSSDVFVKKYRFTLFESETKELKDHINDYKFGGGISYDVETHGGIFVPITEYNS